MQNQTLAENQAIDSGFALAQSEGNHYYVVRNGIRVRGFDALKIDMGPKRGFFVLRGPKMSYSPMRKKQLLQSVSGLLQAN